MNILRSARIQFEQTLRDGYPIDTQEAKAIISVCSYPYLRDPYRERCSLFRKIIDHYNIPIDQKTILDLGPGHFAFFRMCERLGKPKKLVAVEREPALSRLGRHFGYEVIEQDLLGTDFVNVIEPASIDVLFSRGVVDPTQIGSFADWWDAVASRLKANASIWFLPHYGLEVPLEQAQNADQQVREILAKHSISIEETPAWVARYDTHWMPLWLRSGQAS